MHPRPCMVWLASDDGKVGAHPHLSGHVARLSRLSRDLDPAVPEPAIDPQTLTLIVGICFVLSGFRLEQHCSYKPRQAEWNTWLCRHPCMFMVILIPHLSDFATWSRICTANRS